MKTALVMQLVQLVLPMVVRILVSALKEYAEKTDTELDDQILEALISAFGGTDEQIGR